jgi:hypothetical protein
MSTSIDIVVDVEVTEEEAPRLAARVVEHLQRLSIVLPSPQVHEYLDNGPRYARGPNVALAADINDCFPCGLNVTVGRRFYNEGENAFCSISCPACGYAYDIDEIEWGAAVSDWREGRPALLACHRCRHACSVTEWQFEPVWAFGNLAFEFNEWFLKEDFVLDLARLLGHRVRWIHCHI